MLAIAAKVTILAKMVTNFALVVLFAAEVAQAITGDGWGPIINTGVVGCMLAYYLLRTEPRLSRIERAIARSDKANMLLLIGMKSITPAIREQSQRLIDEIDEATNGIH